MLYIDVFSSFVVDKNWGNPYVLHLKAYNLNILVISMYEFQTHQFWGS